MQTYNEKGFLDYTGATVSWICVFHCLAMPFLITFLPLIGLSFLADETAEWIIIAISVLPALVSLFPSYLNQHGKYQSLLLFAAGIGLILTSHLYFEDDFLWKAILISFGAILITSAHLLNRYYCKNCQVCKMEKA